MFLRYARSLVVAASLCYLPSVQAQGHKPTSPAAKGDTFDPASVARGKAQFKSSCGFCHGEDATGSRAPDLVRSAILNHDEQGNLIAPVIHNGRPDKGMPAFPSLNDNQIADIVSFLHHQAYVALHSANVPGDYPVAKLLTGNAEAGKAFFDGPGNCASCHSVSGDLAHVASKYSPVDLQQKIVYPASRRSDVRTATITTADGQHYSGKVREMDEFNIGVICQDGWYRSWPLAQVTAEVKDPLEAHRDLMNKYTDADIHNLFAYLETFK